jgi:ADP-heptose:LPS heptosyltransferase
MALGKPPSRIERYRHQLGMRYRYLSRIVRARFLQLMLKCCLVVFRVELIFRPVTKGDHKRILVVVIGGLGDCLLFDPLFRRLKEKWPGARIDVVSGSFEQMWALMEPVDNLILFTPTKFKTPWSYVKLFHTIFRCRYDVVAEGIAFLPKRGIYPVFTSLVFTASQAPVRIGRPNVGRIGKMRMREMGFIGREEMRRRGDPKRPAANPYLTHTLEIVPPERRTAHESAYIFQPLGLNGDRRPQEPMLAADPASDLWAKERLDQHWPGQDHRPLIGVTLETTRAIKSWPVENYIDIVGRGAKAGYRFLLLGLDRSLSRQVVTHSPRDAVWDQTGQTNLAQMIALIRQCDVFLSGDTGPSHIAQACRVPTVVLFGPSNELEFGPADRALHTLMLPPEEPSCRPCVLGPCVRGQSCVRSIRSEDVYAAIVDKVNQPAGGSRRWQQNMREQPQRILCVI